MIEKEEFSLENSIENSIDDTIVKLDFGWKYYLRKAIAFITAVTIFSEGISYPFERKKEIQNEISVKSSETIDDNIHLYRERTEIDKEFMQKDYEGFEDYSIVYDTNGNYGIYNKKNNFYVSYVGEHNQVSLNEINGKVYAYTYDKAKDNCLDNYLNYTNYIDEFNNYNIMSVYGSHSYDLYGLYDASDGKQLINDATAIGAYVQMVDGDIYIPYYTANSLLLVDNINLNTFQQKKGIIATVPGIYSLNYNYNIIEPGTLYDKEFGTYTYECITNKKDEYDYSNYSSVENNNYISTFEYCKMQKNALALVSEALKTKSNLYLNGVVVDENYGLLDSVFYYKEINYSLSSKLFTATISKFGVNAMEYNILDENQETTNLSYKKTM